MAYDYDRPLPKINARLIGLGLRRVREILELNYEEAVAGFGRDAQWLAAVETGFGDIGPGEVSALLAHYGEVPDRIRSALTGLAARPDGPLWLRPHLGQLSGMLRDILTVEAEADIVRAFGVQAVPDLARTEGYARLLYEHRLLPEDHPEWDWPLLAARQRHRPGGDPRTLDLIVDQRAVAEVLNGHQDVWRGQIEHLLALSRAGHEVRVVPRSAGYYVGLDGSFEIYEVSALNDRLGVVHWPDGLGMSQADLAPQWRQIERVALTSADSALLLDDAIRGRDLDHY
ncbi:helix-turn-helix transcriptional regulator [Actinoallomurus liliacearum]|uniref:Helix-turn-helix transcriptional regulator n=1 Tax=Actinoallomurus liliacearum TaxID=1080073 RepID=A0ABP8T8D6_9ACTN